MRLLLGGKRTFGAVTIGSLIKAKADIGNVCRYYIKKMFEVLLTGLAEWTYFSHSQRSKANTW